MKAAIFDMDGTLLDSMTFWYSLRQRVVDHLDLTLPPGEGVDAKTLSEMMDYISMLSDGNITPEEVHQVHHEIIEGYYTSEAQAKPGVVAYLDLLEKNGVRCCVATETDTPLAHLALRQAGIDEYFGFVISAKDVGTNKHEPTIFYKAAEMLDSSISDVIVFEDSYYAAKTATEAGFKVYSVWDENQMWRPGDITEVSELHYPTFEDYVKYRIVQ